MCSGQPSKFPALTAPGWPLHLIQSVHNHKFQSQTDSLLSSLKPVWDLVFQRENLQKCTESNLHNAQCTSPDTRVKIQNILKFVTFSKSAREAQTQQCLQKFGWNSLSVSYLWIFFDKTPMKSLFKLCNFKLIKTSLVVNIGDNHWQIRILKHKKEDLFHHHDRTLWQTEKAKGWKFFSNMRGWHGKACVKWRGEKYLVKFGDK